MTIEIFNDLYEAVMFIETEAEYHDFHQGELLRLPDGRWRVGVMKKGQLEFALDG